MKSILISALFWLFMLLTVICMYPVYIITWLVTTPFDYNRKIIHFFTSYWATFYIWINPYWKIKIHRL